MCIRDSYIINERTANKLGLKKVTTNGYQALLLLLNYIPLTISISLVKKSIHFPKLKNIKTFQGTIIDIRERKAYLNRLIEKIEKTTDNNV